MMAGMSQEQCADLDPHPAHNWGWKKRCVGVHEVDDLKVTTDDLTLERLAALHHESLRDQMQRSGEAPLWPHWGDLSAGAKKRRVQAMRHVLNDMRFSRKAS